MLITRLLKYSKGIPQSKDLNINCKIYALIYHIFHFFNKKIYVLCQNSGISKKKSVSKLSFTILSRPFIFIVTIMSHILTNV